MTFVPAAATFTLPPRRSHFSRIAFRGPRRAIGIPQQQLSTMGYPRKSYPHRCPPPCAKRSRPRACARVYIIYRSPVGRSRGVSAPLRKRVRAVVPPCPAPPCAGWGRAKAKADAPSRSAEPCRLCAESLCAKAEVHKANPAPARAFSPRQLVYGRAPARRWAKRRVQRRKCTRPTPPLPVRSPRDSLSTAAPSPADGRSAERKGGSAQGQPRPCPCTLPAATCLRPCPRPLMGVAPCVLPAATCLPPRPRRLNGHPASAGGRENDRMAHRRTTTPTHRTQRGNDTCTIRVPRRKGAQSVVHNLYFSSSRPASFCTTFPQSCTDRPATYRKEHKSPPEGLIFRVLPPAFHPFAPKAIVQNTPAPPPFSPRKTPRFAPTRNRAALSRPRDATTRHDLRILHVFSEIRTRRRRTKCQFLPRRRPKMGAFSVSNVKKRPSNEEKHVFIWTISNLTNTFAP